MQGTPTVEEGSAFRMAFAALGLPVDGWTQPNINQLLSEGFPHQMVSWNGGTMISPAEKPPPSPKLNCAEIYPEFTVEGLHALKEDGHGTERLPMLYYCKVSRDRPIH